MDIFEAFVEIQRKEAEKILNGLHKEDFLPAAQIIWDAEEKGNRLHITGIGKPSHVANYGGGGRCHLHFQQRRDG